MSLDQDSPFAHSSRDELIQQVKELQLTNANQHPEKILQEAFDKINLLVMTIDQDGIIVYTNDAFIKVIGWEKETILGENWKSFLELGKDKNKEDHIYTLIKKQGFVDQLKRKFLSKEGDYRTIKFNAVIHHPLSNNQHLTTLIGEDITGKKKVIRALKNTNEQLQDLFENANDLIQVFDLEGRIQFVNRAWKEILQYSDEEILTLNFRDIIAKDHVEETFEYLNTILEKKKDDKFESVITSKNGRNIQVICSVNVRYEKDKPVSFRGIFHDNTEHLRAERAQNLYYKISNLALNSDKVDTLLDNIHKELRTLIAVNNFHVALYDRDQNYLNFPYYVDENIGPKPISMKRMVGKGLTEYSLFNDGPTFLYEEDIQKLSDEGKIELLGPIPKIWLGVPLRLENRTIGVICVKSHSDRNKYKRRHVELLDFISGQIALVIERKRNEEKIIDQTARLNAIFESSSHLIWSVNRRRGLTSFNQNYANAIFRKYKKYPTLYEEGGKKEILILSDSNYHDSIDEKYKLAYSGQAQHFEARNSLENGEVFWRETFLNPIFLPDGRIEEVSGISHDITEKKQWELTLQESEEKFRNIFESFQDIYYRTDLQGYITMISPSGCDITGYSQDEIIGKHISAFFTTDRHQINLIREVLTTGQVKNYETKVSIKDGVALECISNIRLIYNNDGRPIGVDGVARDITYLKAASADLLHAKEIAEKSLKVKENFLANMSHEIRTPMNGVIGMIDLLNETPLLDEQRKYVQTIKKSSETLLTILNDILDLSKIEAGKMQLRLAPISIEQTIEKLHALYFQQALIKKIDLLYSIDSNVPKIILGDETRLLQILSNLTSNAIKFTEKGSVRIQVSLESKKDQLNKIRVNIVDTGIGIPADKLNILFGSFNQIDNSSSKSYGGTGLGLAISKELSNLMNGEIGVQTQSGVGSTFWFNFEANESKRLVETVRTVTNQTLSNEKSIKNYPRILLVDDNAINLFVASEILRKAGCEIDTAGNGLEAIQKVKEQSYRIVLMDIQMPQMDGIEATAEIRKLNLSFTPPIIAMTAYSMKEDKERFLINGMDDYIAKPIKAEMLIAKVKHWLENTQAEIEETVSFQPKTTAQFSNSILNIEIYNKLKELSGVEILVQIYKEFENESFEQIVDCKKHLGMGDIPNILNKLHTLKGVSGTLGVIELETLSRSIETKLKFGYYPELKDDLEQLSEAHDRFVSQYTFILTST